MRPGLTKNPGRTCLLPHDTKDILIMLDEDTIEMLLGIGTLPGTEDTLELPVVTGTAEALPEHLAHDPILMMPPPQFTSVRLFEQVYGQDAPKRYPARPAKGPRMPLRPRDHLLAAATAVLVVVSAATYVMVQSGWRGGLPVSEQERLHPQYTSSLLVVPTSPLVPDTSVPVVTVQAPSRVSPNPGHIPRASRTPFSGPVGHFPASSPAGVTHRPSMPPVSAVVPPSPTYSVSPSFTSSPTPSSPSPSPSSPTPSPSAPSPSASTSSASPSATDPEPSGTSPQSS